MIIIESSSMFVLTFVIFIIIVTVTINHLSITITMMIIESSSRSSLLHFGRNQFHLTLVARPTHWSANCTLHIITNASNNEAHAILYLLLSKLHLVLINSSFSLFIAITAMPF